MFEHKSEPLLEKKRFAGRVLWCVGVALVLVGAALCVGAAGYHLTEGLGWLDAFLNASMILTGMGPVDRVETDAGKVFAICYSLASGFIVLTVWALLLGPVLHRLLHALHVEEKGE